MGAEVADAGELSDVVTGSMVDREVMTVNDGAEFFVKDC